jgi:hypothetical protein
MKHAFAFSRLDLCEFCNLVVPLFKKGRRESRALTAPVDPVRWSTRASRVPKHTGKHYRYSRDIPAFPTRWLYGLLRALPGERRFLSPLPCQNRPAGIDATVAAPGPHDFAVRCRRFVQRAFAHLTPQRPSQPAPTFRDDRETSPLVGTGCAEVTSDLQNCQAESYDFTNSGVSVLKLFNKTEGRACPVQRAG